MKNQALDELRVDWTVELEAQEVHPVVDWTEPPESEAAPIVVDWTDEADGVETRLELLWQSDPEELTTAKQQGAPPGWPRPIDSLEGELPIDLFGYPPPSEEEPPFQWRVDIELDRVRQERRSRRVGVRTVGWMLVLFASFGMGKFMLQPASRAELAYWVTMGQLGQDSPTGRTARATTLMMADSPRAKR
jgi:hypothetical protein